VRRRRLAGLLFLLAAAPPVAAAEQEAVYKARGADARLFDQYDNDGYSLSVSPAADGAFELVVRVSDAPLQSAAPFPTGRPKDTALPASPERDRWADALTGDARLQVEAVERILLGIAATVRYDSDRSRRQDPEAVSRSRRAHCVGFAELAVDLLRRSGISARTVQGVLRTPPSSDAWEESLGGAYHRWIEVFYPDRGWVFSDPWASVNGVDARYIPFGRRALRRPADLSIEERRVAGRLAYRSVEAGPTVVRLRPTAPASARRAR
jgi:hypothetical protein